MSYLHPFNLLRIRVFCVVVSFTVYLFIYQMSNVEKYRYLSTTPQVMAPQCHTCPLYRSPLLCHVVCWQSLLLSAFVTDLYWTPSSSYSKTNHSLNVIHECNIKSRYTLIEGQTVEERRILNIVSSSVTMETGCLLFIFPDRWKIVIVFLDQRGNV